MSFMAILESKGRAKKEARPQAKAANIQSLLPDLVEVSALGLNDTHLSPSNNVHLNEKDQAYALKFYRRCFKPGKPVDIANEEERAAAERDILLGDRLINMRLAKARWGSNKQVLVKYRVWTREGLGSKPEVVKRLTAKFGTHPLLSAARSSGFESRKNPAPVSGPAAKEEAHAVTSQPPPCDEIAPQGDPTPILSKVGTVAQPTASRPRLGCPPAFVPEPAGDLAAPKFTDAHYKKLAEELGFDYHTDHPAADIFPLDETGIGELATDIMEHGQREPIWLFRTAAESGDIQLQILDGRRRFRACIQAGVKPKFETYRENDVIAFVWSLNYSRRHLTTSQKAAIAVEALPQLEAESARRRAQAAGQARGEKQSSVVANLPPEKSRETAAKFVGVSARQVQSAKAVKEKAPELFKAIKDGKLTVHQAQRQTEVRDANAAPVWNIQRAYDKVSRAIAKALNNATAAHRTEFWGGFQNWLECFRKTVEEQPVDETKLGLKHHKSRDSKGDRLQAP